jgi:cytochrome c oxidase subunit IV
MAEHKTQIPTYGAIFVALIGLTGLTVWLGSIDLGKWHTAVGLVVATTKAVLIAFFFMHMHNSSRITWAIAGITLLFLAILLLLTLTDYLTRDWNTGRSAEVGPNPKGIRAN